MPEVIFAGPDGRLEGRYHPQKERDAPIAIVLTTFFGDSFARFASL